MKKILLAVIAVLFLFGCDTGNSIPKEDPPPVVVIPEDPPVEKLMLALPILQGGVIGSVSGRSILVENVSTVVNELYGGTKQLAVASWDTVEVFPDNMTFTETVHGNIVTFHITVNENNSVTYTGYFTDDGMMVVTYWAGLESKDEVLATYGEDGVTEITPYIPAVIGYPAKYESFTKLAIKAESVVYNFETKQNLVEIVNGTVDNSFTTYVYIAPNVHNTAAYQVIKRTFDTVIADGVIGYQSVNLIRRNCETDLRVYDTPLGDKVYYGGTFPMIEAGENEYSETFWNRIKALF